MMKSVAYYYSGVLQDIVWAIHKAAGEFAYGHGISVIESPNTGSWQIEVRLTDQQTKQTRFVQRIKTEARAAQNQIALRQEFMRILEGR